MRKPANMHRTFRDPVSGLTHLCAAVLALAGTALLLLKSRGDLAIQVVCLIYGGSLCLLFSASATHHVATGSQRIIGLLRKLDHSAIFLLIAGSYTPVAYLVLQGAWRWSVLIVVWTLAVAGIVQKAILGARRRWLYTALYLAMGWMGLALIDQLYRALPLGVLVWLVLGGLIYTAGGLVYILKRPDPYPGVFGFHEIWHLFVIGGALCHFLMVLFYIVPYGAPPWL